MTSGQRRQNGQWQRSSEIRYEGTGLHGGWHTKTDRQKRHTADEEPMENRPWSKSCLSPYEVDDFVNIRTVPRSAPLVPASAG